MFQKEQISICRTMMEATTGPLITHQRAVFSFVSQHLQAKESSAFQSSFSMFSLNSSLWPWIYKKCEDVSFRSRVRAHSSGGRKAQQIQREHLVIWPACLNDHVTEAVFRVTRNILYWRGTGTFTQSYLDHRNNPTGSLSFSALIGTDTLYTLKSWQNLMCIRTF